MKQKKVILKRVIIENSLHIWGIFLLVNVVVFYTFHFYLIASSCMTPQQVNDDSRCLYIMSGKIYNKGTRGAPHMGHPCGTDVTSVIPASHVGNVATYLVPNYVADVCSAAPSPTATPTPTSVPTSTPTSTPVPTIVLNTPAPTLSPSPVQLIPTSTILPTPTNQPTPTLVPTSLPTPTSAPTVTVNAGDTTLNLTIFIHGIGKAGDGANPVSDVTVSPINPQRVANVKLFNDKNELVSSGNGTVIYNQTEGNFKGKVNLGTHVSTGSYFIEIKILFNVAKKSETPISVISGQENNVPAVNIFSGDINNDDTLSVLDYNILRDCFTDNLPAMACADPGKKSQADINNDGRVNQIDYNLFLRESKNIANN